MRLSIITAILNSHEIVQRQVYHYAELNLDPEEIEIIFVDDGSDPPLDQMLDHSMVPSFSSIATNDFRDWTQPAARNFGVKQAIGDYIICTDIDHILSKELIDTVQEGATDVIRFKREVGILNEDGSFTQDKDVLLSYGLSPERLESRGLRLVPHTNSFGIRRDLYWKLGGVSERRVGSGKHPNREEAPLKRGYKALAQAGKITINSDEERPTIYMIPNGRYCGDKDFNPFGLFHNLERMNR